MILKKIYFFIKTIYVIIIYRFSAFKRYSGLLLTVIFKRPKIILEIGVYKGKRAKQMIEAAKIFNSNIKYYGFDLFENFYLEKNILKKEYSKKPDNFKTIKKKLSKDCNINLYKGFTNKTLPKFLKKNIKPDIVFIDGGHSIDTIKIDWKYISQCMNKENYSNI